MSYFKARDARKSLPEEFQKRYIIKEYFPDIEAAWLLQNASLVLARSGANTVMELAVLSKHAILIPLPWAGAGEQYKQALWLQQLGLGHVMDQKTTTSDTLREQINLFMKQSPAGSPRQDLPLHKDAASRVVKIIESL
jgi:UDP-N-acetylglucosamine:LPS N-acetylglucosamine transferase